ncbi:hypothetical protein Golax_010823, partial [Gossypium laxum]|nr:hypothetical protein [Gossypium laxum]
MRWAVVLRNDEDNVVMETNSQRLWQAFHHDYEDASDTRGELDLDVLSKHDSLALDALI